MTFLPIAERELRVASRRRSTFWLRFLMPLGLLLLATWVLVVSDRESQREIGKVIFYLLTGGLTLFALTSGMRSTADSLAEEKREGTLGLLFLTDLRGYDVVVGKLLANSLSVFYGVLAVLPILAVPLLMGGVAGAEVGRMAIVLVNTLLFSLSAGMLASAWCKNARSAVFTTLLLILVFAGGFPALGMLEWKLRNSVGVYLRNFLIPSPVFSYFSGVDDLFTRGYQRLFYWSVGIVHLASWMFLGLASLRVRVSWQDKPATQGSEKVRDLRRQVLEGDRSQRNDFRTRLLNMNAFFWLASRPRQRAWWSWTPLVVGLGIWIWGIAELGKEWFNPGVYAATAILLGITFKAMIGAESGRRLIEDRKVGSLELLLSTPLSICDILRGQALALKRQFGGPVIVSFFLMVILLIAGGQNRHMSGHDRVTWHVVGIAGMIVFVADAVALYWLGMWTGLSSKNPKNAFGAAVIPILALPWGAIAIIMTFFSIVMPRGFQRSFNPEYWVWGMWFVFSLAIDLVLAYIARRGLLGRFRELATQRFQPKPNLWQRLWGKS